MIVLQTGLNIGCVSSRPTQLASYLYRFFDVASKEARDLEYLWIPGNNNLAFPELWGLVQWSEFSTQAWT